MTGLAFVAAFVVLFAGAYALEERARARRERLRRRERGLASWETS